MNHWEAVGKEETKPKWHIKPPLVLQDRSLPCMDLDGQGSPQPSLFQNKGQKSTNIKNLDKMPFLYFILKRLHQCITMQYIAILIFRGELPFSNAFA